MQNPTDLHSMDPATQHAHAQQENLSSLSITVFSRETRYQPDALIWKILKISQVHAVADVKTLLEKLTQSPMDYVILDLDSAKPRFLDQVKRAQASLRFIFLVEEPYPDELLALSYRGYSFFCLPGREEPECLADAFQKALFHRKEYRAMPQNFTLAFTTESPEGRRYQRPLFDLSNGGAAWILDSRDSCRHLLPNTLIQEVCVLRDQQLVLKVERARIRHISPVKGTSLCRVGVEFLAAERSCGETVLNDPIRIRAILKRAFDHTSFYLAASLHDTLRVHPGSYAPEEKGFSKETFCLSGEWPTDWKPPRVVRVSFTLDSREYDFFTTLEERIHQYVRLRNPGEMKATSCPHLLPQQPSHPSPVFVEFKNPFSGKAVRAQPLHLSTQYLIFEINQTVGPLPAGTRLDEIRIEGLLPEPISTSGRMCSIQWVEKNKRLFHRCLVELADLSEKEQFAAADQLISRHLPGVESGQGLDAEEIWNFFYAARFIYPEKEAQMKPVLHEVKHTLSTLNFLQRRNQIRILLA